MRIRRFAAGEETTMTLNEIWAKARELMAPNCRACPVCNGRACKGEVPGVGAMGDGSSWTVCTEFLERVKVRMDTLHEPWTPDASTELFGVRLAAPLCLAPIGGMSHNYNGAITDEYWSNSAAAGCRDAGILAFTGDNALGVQFELGLEAIRANGGFGVPTVKPWRDNAKIIKRAEACAEAGCPAIACDVDTVAYANMGSAVSELCAKSVDDLAEIARNSPIPFVVKGVMTAEGALKCADAGCSGIIVSTHGGRVITSAQSTAEVLPEIRAAVGDRLTVIVDGGIRTGYDIFKVLALGADAAMIGRPFVVAAVGGSALDGGAEGVAMYADAKRAELENLMIMTNCRTVDAITADRVVIS